MTLEPQTIFCYYECSIPDEGGKDWVQPISKKKMQSMTMASHEFAARLTRKLNRASGLMQIDSYRECATRKVCERPEYEEYMQRAFLYYTAEVPAAALRAAPSLRGIGGDHRIYTSMVVPVPTQWFANGRWSENLSGISDWAGKQLSILAGLMQSKIDYFQKYFEDESVRPEHKAQAALMFFAPVSELSGPAHTTRYY